MSKSTISVTIETTLLEKARELKINISAAAESGIAKRVKEPLPEYKKQVKQDRLESIISLLSPETKAELAEGLSKGGLFAKAWKKGYVKRLTGFNISTEEALELGRRLKWMG